MFGLEDTKIIMTVMCVDNNKLRIGGRGVVIWAQDASDIHWHGCARNDINSGGFVPGMRSRRLNPKDKDAYSGFHSYYSSTSRNGDKYFTQKNRIIKRDNGRRPPQVLRGAHVAVTPTEELERKEEEKRIGSPFFAVALFTMAGQDETHVGYKLDGGENVGGRSSNFEFTLAVTPDRHNDLEAHTRTMLVGSGACEEYVDD